MLNKLNLNKMVWRLVVVALLLGLYYLLPIQEGMDKLRTKKKAPPATPPPPPPATTKERVTKMFGRNTERRPRPRNIS